MSNFDPVHKKQLQSELLSAIECQDDLKLWAVLGSLQTNYGLADACKVADEIQTQLTDAQFDWFARMRFGSEAFANICKIAKTNVVSNLEEKGWQFKRDFSFSGDGQL